ncbi:rhodanese-like domain-containing protein [Cytobacillus suaedae]|nr:rhodanese-like domain-containing protein [Cytobacillus suaedae]
MDFSIIVNIVLLGLLIGIAVFRFKPVKGLRNLNEQEMKDKIKSTKSLSIIDVREPYEYNVKHIPGAINVPLSKLKWRKVDVPTDKEIVLYCQTGIRSKQAARLIMKRHKINELSQLAGGFFSWKGETSHNRKAIK